MMLLFTFTETLIHSTMTQYDSGADFTIQILLDKEYTVYVRKRPFLHEFLERVSKMFEIIIFTASKKIYAEKLLDVLDPEKKLFSHRAYRDSCLFQDGTYTKDLTVLGIDLAKVAIVDNSPQVFLIGFHLLLLFHSRSKIFSIILYHTVLLHLKCH